MLTAASRAELEALLNDDVPYGDLTTEALGLGSQVGVMRFIARDPMVAALVEDAAALIELAGAGVEPFVRSGATLDKGIPILAAHGPASALLRSWKVAQTLIEIWSGIATEARAIVTAARAVQPEISIACTRKNVPGVKRFAVAAVKAGGAVMHRLGLSETVLVFPEHRVFLAGSSLADIAGQLRRAAPEKRLVIEVNDVEQGTAAAMAGFDVIQAEKFAPDAIATLVAQVEALGSGGVRPIIAAAGGVNAQNAAAYASAGADVLVTSAPYLARPRDVQVVISAATENGGQSAAFSAA